jgi:hypothetical protein
MSNNTICHYTNLDGFKGIIDSNGFWATNLSFLNDKSELIHGLECAEKAIEFIGDAELYEGWKDDFKSAAKELKHNEVIDLFVICFCRSPDLLSQWRGYGGTQQGVSIVFHEDALIELLRNNASGKTGAGVFGNLVIDDYSVSAKDVIYKKVNDTLTIKEQIHEYWSGYNDFISSLAEEDNNGYEDRYIKWLVGSIAPFFKHSGFQEEGEFRVLIGNYKGVDAVSFRTNGRRIIPYLDLKGLGTLPIKEVIVGPNEDYESIHNSLRMFLNARGYSSVKIEKSEIPFRGQ